MENNIIKIITIQDMIESAKILNSQELIELDRVIERLLILKKKEAKTTARKKLIDITKDLGLNEDDILDLLINKKESNRTPKGKPKYFNPNNPEQTWTGRGKPPQWYYDAMANSNESFQSKEEFLKSIEINF